MKLALFALVVAGSLIALANSAEEEYDYEEEQAAPVTPAPARATSGRLGGLLSPRGRVNVGRKTTGAGAATTQSTTAKPVEQPLEEEEEGEEELDENQEQDDVPTTTTESTKKVRGGVRPFRSNQDLLAALKRRRAQVGPSHRESSGTQSASESTTPKPKPTTNGRSKSNSATDSKSSGRGRFGGSRGSKPVQEEVEETQREEVQVKPKPYRRG
ncbi:uncharacterized protein LOC128894289 [Hylaeus anthracinus]|uniref:uncharacterized protein LOC128878255 n=1 Tax=Hylaeus volcanicus TaxID=313075 RepID=UPI0023B7955C|nr:uncharacterized protein LOC128878255 [Hylaeus volcanicus]XP_054011924.1 uncharacterized protein LOC128894289 [Hylaeus anthracinus]